MKKILLLGSGELGKELVISLKRLGCTVIACDSYAGAPAMQVADGSEVFSMLDGTQLLAAVHKHRPNLIVPEIEAINTDILLEVEARGYFVVPSARAVNMTMNRDRIRNYAAGELDVRTARFTYAESAEELRTAGASLGYPVVVKPVMSSSGKGQTMVPSPNDIGRAWDYALSGMRGDRPRVIVEEFIDFAYEITLLTIATRNQGVLYCPPVGHRQERGDYQESWQPCPMPDALVAEAQRIAARVVTGLGGVGIFGVEFFVPRGEREVIFSELSPRPHDTGMVTLISQPLSEFDLHARAILGLPIPETIEVYGPSASAVILAHQEMPAVAYQGIPDGLTVPGTDVRIFGKPNARNYRRMGVALARAATVEQARHHATEASRRIRVVEAPYQ